ncbi:MAG: NAD(P)-binding domain-containing protein, partial [Burkholderiales bacterium]|nr:NAD(P)-binding domain-containing protein [Burkholderiales bacterium]
MRLVVGCTLGPEEVAAIEKGEALRAAEVIVLAVKPQQMREACLAARPYLARPLVVSVAA